MEHNTAQSISVKERDRSVLEGRFSHLVETTLQKVLNTFRVPPFPMGTHTPNQGRIDCCAHSPIPSTQEGVLTKGDVRVLGNSDKKAQ